jgi:hypothetical protein
MLAYIDPGSGSFIFQALIAAFAGAMVAGHAYWKRIKRFLGLSSREEPEAGSSDRESAGDD